MTFVIFSLSSHWLPPVAIGVAGVFITWLAVRRWAS